MVNISTLGLGTQSILQIRNVQAQLDHLTEQLATGKRSSSLSDYTLTETRRILDFRTDIAKRTSYLDVINIAQPRMKIYDNSLTSLTDITNQALSLANSTENFEEATNTAVSSQVKGFMDQFSFFLNQKLGDRNLFAGGRYTTKPVGDLDALATVTDSDAVTTGTTLAAYDTQAPGTSAAAYTKDSVTIDDNYTVQYGISSNDAAFQNLALGLRWMKAAANDSANYAADMAKARDFLTAAKPLLATLQGTNAANLSRLDDLKQQHTTFISTLTNEVSNIQTIDSAEVATKITFAQSRLQASYSATAIIAQLSLTKYI